MTATPPGALALCIRLPLVRATCPQRVPAGRFRDASRPPGFAGPVAGPAIAVCEDKAGSVPVGSRTCRDALWILEAGAPAGLPPDGPPGLPGKRLGPARTRPPQYVHLMVEAARGSLVHSVPFHWPRGRPRRISDRLLDPRRSAAVFLGRHQWGGHHGTLVLAPPLAFGGADGDHLIFLWVDRGVGHKVSMHSWAPLAEAVATLRAVVDSATPS